MSAVADLVDNSVTAGATQVDVELVFEGADSYVVVADNGRGMTRRELVEALRFGSRRTYAVGELGRYGLGLKTASISQCRQVTVMTRRAPQRRRLTGYTLDLDHIEAADRWEITDPPSEPPIHRCLEWLNDGPGTVVFWRELDRVLPDSKPDGGWARRRISGLSAKTGEFLGMVFHRFLEGLAGRSDPLTIMVNGEKVSPWNPFAPMEETTARLDGLTFEVAHAGGAGVVRLERHVLPPRGRFSSQAEFERLSGPRKWNRQQGLYVYRADRLIQYGGWSGLRAIDEHTKLARAEVHFQTDLDEAFQINVAKMRVALPTELRTLMEQPIAELAHVADTSYREEGARRRGERERAESSRHHAESPPADARALGAAIVAAGLGSGEFEALRRIMTELRRTAPQSAAALGW